MNEEIQRMTPHEACEEAAFALRARQDDSGLADLLQNIGRTMHDAGAPFIGQAAVVARNTLHALADADEYAAKCVCTDSVRSKVGTCPPPGDREYAFCPRRRAAKDGS
ncbi:hypothetical protein ACBJ59_12265 [Nonomuraea sp. MTCD27]|uniref:hypothetical protein n=1 Tax=Nonomuraea sp. MTCD27 TaxID=1676747 RepID=UPI0035BFE314